MEQLTKEFILEIGKLTTITGVIIGVILYISSLGFRMADDFFFESVSYKILGRFNLLGILMGFSSCFFPIGTIGKNNWVICFNIIIAVLLVSSLYYLNSSKSKIQTNIPYKGKPKRKWAFLIAWAIVSVLSGVYLSYLINLYLTNPSISNAIFIMIVFVSSILLGSCLGGIAGILDLRKITFFCKLDNRYPMNHIFKGYILKMDSEYYTIKLDEKETSSYYVVCIGKNDTYCRLVGEYLEPAKTQE